MSRVYGRTMVDKNFLPLGMALIYFAPDGTHEIHAHFGKWFRKFPKDIMNGMRPVTRRARDAGVNGAYAIADEAIEGSIDLVRWFEGKPTGKRNETPPVGDIYWIDFHSPRVTRWLSQKDR